jgi:IPT/TIG domain
MSDGVAAGGGIPVAGRYRRPVVRVRRDGHHEGQEPNTRALAAMAEAARRSRQSEVGAPARPPGVLGSPAVRPSPTGGGAPDPSPVGGPATPARRAHPPGRSMLIASLGLLAVAAVVVGSSIMSRGTPSSHSAPAADAGQGRVGSPRPPSARASGPATTGPLPASSPAAAAPTTTSSPTTTTSTTAPTTTTSTSPPSAGGPVLTTLAPSTGAPGQIVVITGANLISPSGLITAHFGSQVALVACPESSGCLVAVPAPDGTTGGSAPVTVTTDGGTSNPLTFTYG